MSVVCEWVVEWGGLLEEEGGGPGEMNEGGRRKTALVIRVGVVATAITQALPVSPPVDQWMQQHPHYCIRSSHIVHFSCDLSTCHRFSTTQLATPQPATCKWREGEICNAFGSSTTNGRR